MSSRIERQDNPHRIPARSVRKSGRRVSIFGFLRLALAVAGIAALPPPDASAFAVFTNSAEDRIGYASWGVYYLNQPPVYYAEDYYSLYARRNYYNEPEINLNIVYMQGALKSPFRPAYKALVPLHTELEQKKYRSLIRMHCNLRILQDYLYLGRQYDMQDLYFYHKEFKDDLIKSLRTAKFQYETAQGYWTEVKRHAVDAYLLRETAVGLDDLEDEMELIVTRDVDWQYDRILRVHLDKVEANLRRLESLP
jgi:hypothetical protein